MELDEHTLLCFIDEEFAIAERYLPRMVALVEKGLLEETHYWKLTDKGQVALENWLRRRAERISPDKEGEK